MHDAFKVLNDKLKALVACGRVQSLFIAKGVEKGWLPLQLLNPLELSKPEVPSETGNNSILLLKVWLTQVMALLLRVVMEG